MTADETKPIIVLVHGAWHPPHVYRPLISALRARGHTVLAPPNATCGPDDSVAGRTYADDVRRVHEALLPRLDAGREAVLVCHSLGGIAGSAAAEGQTVADRSARGLPGGIRAVVYVAAFAFAERGVSLFQASGEKIPYFFYEEDEFLMLNEKAGMAFYSDLPEEKRNALVEGLVYQSRASIHAPAHFVALDVNADKTYVICTGDQAVPAEVQKHFAEAAKCKPIELESDHSPWLKEHTKAKLVEIITDVAK